MKQLFSKVMGFILMIIILALAPSIITANTAIGAHANITQATALSTVDDFGPPIMILALLATSGFFAYSGMKNRLKGASMKQMLSVVGIVIVAIIGLTLFETILTYVAALIYASAPVTQVGNFGVVIYKILPLMLYLAIVAGAAGYGAVTYRKMSKRSKKAKTASAYGY